MTSKHAVVLINNTYIRHSQATQARPNKVFLQVQLC